MGSLFICMADIRLKSLTGIQLAGWLKIFISNLVCGQCITGDYSEFGDGVLDRYRKHRKLLVGRIANFLRERAQFSGTY